MSTTRYYEAIVPYWEPEEGGSTYYVAATDEVEARSILARETHLHDRADQVRGPDREPHPCAP
mgnify:CR=1 FL=1